MSEKKFWNNIRFQKQMGRHEIIRNHIAPGNVTIVYVTSLLFGLIGRLCPKECKKSKSCSVSMLPVTRCNKDKSMATVLFASFYEHMLEDLKLTSAKKRCDWECK